jgi:cell division protein FtsQ
VTRRRRSIRLLAATALLAVLVAAGWLWVRDSALARVERVTVVGATSSEEGRIRAALESAALDMTTLHVRREALHDAVEPFASVAGLRVETSFPHELTIEVLERRPVAVLDVDGELTAVSGGGLVLAGVAADPRLPAITRRSLPPDGRVTDERTSGALAIAASAPAELRVRGERIVDDGDRGLTVELRDGPPLIFGSGDDAEAKWAGATRVLADPNAAGATYLDLRVPGRVAAGGVGPIPQAEPGPIPQP